MNAKKAKRMRQLAHHIEFGGNYPAMTKSGIEFDKAKLTAKQKRRAEKMAEKKMAKIMFVDGRSDAAYPGS